MNMTKNQAESLYIITASPHWQAYIDIKQDKLNALHKQLEWDAPENMRWLQGQIAQIRMDIELRKRVENYLDGK
jgi:hypothetical protein